MTHEVSNALAALDRLDGDPADRHLIASTIKQLEGRIKCAKNDCPNEATPDYLLCAACAAKRGNV